MVNSGHPYDRKELLPIHQGLSGAYIQFEGLKDLAQLDACNAGQPIFFNPKVSTRSRFYLPNVIFHWFSCQFAPFSGSSGQNICYQTLVGIWSLISDQWWHHSLKTACGFLITFSYWKAVMVGGLQWNQYLDAKCRYCLFGVSSAHDGACPSAFTMYIVLCSLCLN